MRLHIEFRYPVEPGKSGQGRGNSGIFPQGDQYEVQVLNIDVRLRKLRISPPGFSRTEWRKWLI